MINQRGRQSLCFQNLIKAFLIVDLCTLNHIQWQLLCLWNLIKLLLIVDTSTHNHTPRQKMLTQFLTRISLQLLTTVYVKSCSVKYYK